MFEIFISVGKIIDLETTTQYCKLLRNEITHKEICIENKNCVIVI